KGTNTTSGETSPRRGPQGHDGWVRAGEIEGQAGARIRSRGRQHGDRREGAIRYRRHRRGAAATGARGDEGRNYRGYAYRGKAYAPDREDTDSERDVLRASNRVDWTDGKTGTRRGLRCEDREIPVCGQQQSHDSGEPRRIRQSGFRRIVRRSAGDSHHRAAGDGASRGSRDGAEPRGHDR